MLPGGFLLAPREKHYTWQASQLHSHTCQRQPELFYCLLWGPIATCFTIASVIGVVTHYNEIQTWWDELDEAQRAESIGELVGSLITLPFQNQINERVQRGTKKILWATRELFKKRLPRFLTVQPGHLIFGSGNNCRCMQRGGCTINDRQIFNAKKFVQSIKTEFLLGENIGIDITHLSIKDVSLLKDQLNKQLTQVQKTRTILIHRTNPSMSKKL